MAGGTCGRLRTAVSRKRHLEPRRKEGTELKRCLNFWGVTSLGVSSSLGVGVYVVVGVVALQLAGPSVLISFLVAAVASMLAGLCYAEFSARVPLAGSAYVYAYVTLGEFVAFLVGWTNILEYIFGTAALARGLSLYVDTASNQALSSWFATTMPLGLDGISPYFDLFAFLLVVVVGIILSVGVRQSTLVNNALCIVNIIIVLFIVILGAIKADVTNWYLTPEEVPSEFGAGGYFPYGVWGMLKGAAVCFYGFVGFHVVTSTSEEVQEPQRTIPITILSVLLILFGVYAAVSIVFTMIVPYFAMSGITPLSTAFQLVGWEWAKWIVTVGAIFAITSSVFSSLFPLPRLLYSMASDGLFMPWFAKVSSANKSPVIATLIPTVIIGLLAGLLELGQLVLMMCVGTLVSYTIVSACVVLLRYRSERVSEMPATMLRTIIGCGDKRSTTTTTKVTEIALFVFLCLCIAMAVILVHTPEPMIPGIILHVLALAVMIVIALQPNNVEKLSFKTPFVPLIPCLSIYVNVHLMIIISWQTWIRVLIWVLVGLPIYFMCLCCYKQRAVKLPGDNTILKPFATTNGKPCSVVQIIVEEPTPPMTRNELDDIPEAIEIDDKEKEIIKEQDIVVANKTEELVLRNAEMHEVLVENNEEKEAKIIDLLDKVLQAEEDSYCDVESLKDDNEINTENESIPHRKSLSELSDAGSDVSGHILSKYDVVAQVHREDLPKLNEEEEKLDEEIDMEEITAFNESETNSQTDESGYSDTIDRLRYNDSIDENISNIPIPPPMPAFEEDDKSHFRKFNTMPSRLSKDESENEYLGDTRVSSQSSNDFPTPPPMPPFDENYFKSPNFKKFNTISSRPSKADLNEDEINEPRVSIQSNSTYGGDGNIRFGSDRQMKFMNKLNDIFQKSIAPNEEDREEREEEEPRRRSQSTGNVPDTGITLPPERPSIFLDLKKELLSREAAQNLKPVIIENKATDTDSESDEDKAMSRHDLKSKLENIFAAGGPQLLKPRLMKSNPPTPEESYQTDHSSTESIPKLPKMEKNDTLKRQKARFGEVLNSFRLSMNKDDDV